MRWRRERRGAAEKRREEGPVTDDPGFWLEGCGADFGGCGAKGERGSRLGLSVFSGTHLEWARQAGLLRDAGK